ncbi:GAF and ANTAR domain-containing protein [Actinomadura sp. 6N118]|uniref:GAF and ANTAR domain-containing protein n=1 Tax=Actinomadura sp. 6N118 TaxID=3375151 RepID=UPI0037877F04
MDTVASLAARWQILRPHAGNGAGMDRRERAWRRAAELAAGGGPVSLETVCAAATEAITADGYGVTLVSAPGLREFACASDPVGVLVEEVQLACGEGPCTDAYSSLAAVLVPDLDDAAERWPGFVAPVAGQGVRAVFAFPLQVAGVRVGAIDFYRRQASALTADEATDAGAFAAVAAQVAFRSHPAPAALAAVSGDEPPHGFPPVVHQAAGMLAAQLEVSVEEALVRLRAYAFLHAQPLTGLARQVLERRLALEDDHEPGSGR